MTTLATSPHATQQPARAGAKYDRLFYSGIAIALGLTVLAGFSATYYLRFLSGGPTATISGGPFTRIVHIHGALFTTWILLFMAQTALVAARRVAVHRRLGILGAVLAAAMIIAGTRVAIEAAGRNVPIAGTDPLAFLVIPLFDMVLFTTFITTALVKRRDKESHKRLMLLAYISIVVAAVARLPGVLVMGPPAFFGLTLLYVVAAAAYDFVSRGRVHRVYVWGGALIVLSIPLRLAISTTEAWRAFARMLVG